MVHGIFYYEPSGGRLSLPHLEEAGLPAAFCVIVFANLLGLQYILWSGTSRF